MRVLHRKALRDLWDHRLSFGACALMVALAVALFVAFYSSFVNLGRSTEETYRRLKFLDFYVPLEEAPARAVQRVGRIPGVSVAEGRRVAEVSILLDARGHGDSEGRRMEGRVLGVPPDRRPGVNDLYVEEGSWLGAPRGEALLEARFARSQDLSVGDRIWIRRGDRTFAFRVAGLVASPEYLWIVRTRYDLLPSRDTFGILFVSDRDAAEVAGSRNFQEVHVRVVPGRDRDQVMREAREALDSFTRFAPVPREEQASNALVLRDRNAFLGVALLFPLVFLSLSGTVLFSSLWQIVSRQRRQVGVLLAQGLDQGELARHYCMLGLASGVAGALVGLLAGLALGEVSTRFYASRLGLPYLHMQPPWAAMAAALAGVATLSLGASWLAAGRILRLDPAQALRAEFNETARGPRLEALLPGVRLPLAVRLPVRNLFRNPLRTVVAVLGVALAVAQILMTLALFDSQQAMLDFFNREVLRYDLEVLISRPTAPADLPAMDRWPGVRRVEAFLVHPAVIHGPERDLETNVMGAPSGSLTTRTYTPEGHLLDPSEGRRMYLGTLTARRLRVQPGSRVDVQLDTGLANPPDRRFTVGAETLEPVAGIPRVPLRQLQELLARSTGFPGNSVNDLQIQVDPEALPSVLRRLYEVPSVGGVVVREQVRSQIEDLLRMLDAYKNLMLVFSCVLSFALLLAATSLNVLDRSRELATLSSLGVSDRTLGGLLLAEVMFLWVLGLALGLPGGWLLGDWLLGSYQSEMVQMTLVLRPATLVGTAWISLVMCLAAAAHAFRRILRIPPTLAWSDRIG